jgi:hypothetical protein
MRPDAVAHPNCKPAHPHEKWTGETARHGTTVATVVGEEEVLADKCPYDAPNAQE